VNLARSGHIKMMETAERRVQSNPRNIDICMCTQNNNNSKRCRVITNNSPSNIPKVIAEVYRLAFVCDFGEDSCTGR